MSAFAKAERPRKYEIILRYPHPWLIDEAIEILNQAGDYRGAEARFQGAITPLAGVLDVTAAARVLDVAMDNAQVWDASGIPEMLADLATVLARHGRLDAATWLKLVEFYRDKHKRYAWELLAERLRNLGITVPPESPEEEE